MSIALIGSHRTGKTTLARLFAEKHDMPFVQTGASDVFRALKLDPKVEYPIDQRIAIQAVILGAFEDQYRHAIKSYSGMFITDRSPLDLASYMLADIQRSTLVLTPALATAVNLYVDKCIKSTNRFFSLVVLVQPGIVTVEAEGKAPACPAFMEHMNALCTGLMGDERVETQCRVIPRRHTDLDRRVTCIEHAISGTYDKHEKRMRTLADGGLQIH